jgi:DNA-binding GntR family transcriptional regulator
MFVEVTIMTTTNQAPKTEHIAVLVLRELADAQDRGERLGLDELVSALGVRRGELRTIVSRLHRQGLVDALRMRPTLAGFAIGRTAAGLTLRALREVPAAPVSFRAA